MKLQSKVKVVGLELDRKHFTRHGLHLNYEGKTLVSKTLALVVQNQGIKYQSVPISAKWKDSPFTNTHSVTHELNPKEGTSSSASSPIFEESVQHIKILIFYGYE